MLAGRAGSWGLILSNPSIQYYTATVFEKIIRTKEIKAP